MRYTVSECSLLKNLPIFHQQLAIYWRNFCLGLPNGSHVACRLPNRVTPTDILNVRQPFTYSCELDIVLYVKHSSSSRLFQSSEHLSHLLPRLMLRTQSSEHLPHLLRPCLTLRTCQQLLSPDSPHTHTCSHSFSPQLSSIKTRCSMNLGSPCTHPFNIHLCPNFHQNSLLRDDEEHASARGKTDISRKLANPHRALRTTRQSNTCTTALIF